MPEPRTKEDLSRTQENALIPRADRRKRQAASGAKTDPENRRTGGGPEIMRENNELGRGNQGDGANRREEREKQRDREILSRAQRSRPIPQVIERKLEDVPGTRIISGNRKQHREPGRLPELVSMPEMRIRTQRNQGLSIATGKAEGRNHQRREILDSGQCLPRAKCHHRNTPRKSSSY